MTKKIAVIGLGTSGTQSIAHLVKHLPECEFDWYFDPQTPPQSVGEGAPLTFPRNLSQNISFNYFIDLPKVDGTLKTGIFKENWGEKYKSFFHEFPPPSVSMHFNAVKLQNYIFDKIKDKVNVYDMSVSHKDIDASYIVDCSGSPKKWDECHKANYIPVNNVHIAQCYWDSPTFDYTLTIARPYGWIFGIPLQNRCSIGYLYNNLINTRDEVEEDLQEFIKEYKKKYNLCPSSERRNFPFKNYFRKKNYLERVAFNGNSSFFLEPLEATSTALMDTIQRSVYDIVENNISIQHANKMYLAQVHQIQNVICLHYFAGSRFKTDFWQHARSLAEQCMKEMCNDTEFKQMYLNFYYKNEIAQCHGYNLEYGTWWLGSFVQNIEYLGIKKHIDDLMQQYRKEL